VAAALVSANEIVLFGHGIGKSNAAQVLEQHLKKHHVELSRRIKAAETADLSALTDPEIEVAAMTTPLMVERVADAFAVGA